MKPSRLVLAISLAALLPLSAACVRTPTRVRCVEVVQKHFKKYGKKYPATVYGKSRVKEVDITSQQEIHKHLVAVESFLTLEDGTVQRIHATLEKRPLGWRLMSWENATGM